MKRIQQTLTVGKSRQSMDMYACLKMDGQTLNRFKCESMIGNFARFLLGQFSGGHALRPHLPYRSTSHRELTGVTDAGEEFGNTTRVRTTWTSMFDNYFTDIDSELDGFGEDFLYLAGITGDYSHLNGYYRIQRHSGTWARLYDMDGNPVPFAGGDHNGSGFMFRVHYERNHADGNATDFNIWHPVVGIDNTAVSVRDMFLHSGIVHGSDPGQLSLGGVNVSALATDKPTSRFTISRSFTNISGADIAVKEIGLATRGTSATSEPYPEVLIARDVLDEGIIIPDGKTLTVDYEVIIELTPDTQDPDAEGTNGGFLQAFMSRLRNIARQYDRWYPQYFNCATAGGYSSENPSTNSANTGFTKGVQVGTANGYVSMTDATLLEPVEHGDDPGQLFFHGMSFNPVHIDVQANRALFGISRVFENRTGDPLVIKEIGIAGNTTLGTSHNGRALLARTALHPDDQVTVQPGQFALVEYQVEIIV